MSNPPPTAVSVGEGNHPVLQYYKVSLRDVVDLKSQAMSQAEKGDHHHHCLRRSYLCDDRMRFDDVCLTLKLECSHNRISW